MNTLLAVLTLAGATHGTPIAWQASYPHALQTARQAGQPLLVDFEAEWCGWCKLMDKETYGDARVRAALTNVVCVKVDTDRDTGTAMAFQVSSMPRLVVIDAKGRVIGDHIGYLPADKFLPWLNETLAQPESQRGEYPAAPGGVELDVMRKIRDLDTSTGGWDVVVGYLGHADAAVRETAASRLRAAGAASHPALVKALGSPQLALRIAALELLDAGATNHPPFDPWAPASARAASLTAWAEWLR